MTTLEQPADPVAYHGWILRDVLFDSGEPVGHREPQPTREWVGLTDDEVGDAANNANTYTEAVRMTAAKLKEKNT
jgi:hypothetical protein